MRKRIAAVVVGAGLVFGLGGSPVLAGAKPNDQNCAGQQASTAKSARGETMRALPGEQASELARSSANCGDNKPTDTIVIGE